MGEAEPDIVKYPISIWKTFKFQVERIVFIILKYFQILLSQDEVFSRKTEIGHLFDMDGISQESRIKQGTLT